MADILSMKILSFLFIILMILSTHASNKTSLSKRMQAKQLRVDQQSVINGLTQVSRLNKSSSLQCTIDDDDDEEIPDLVECGKPIALKAGCVNTEAENHDLVYRSNIVSIECSICDVNFNATAKIRQPSTKDKALIDTAFGNYYFENPRSQVSIENLKTSCLDFIKGKKFSYNEQDRNQSLEEAISEMSTLRDFFKLQEDSFVNIVGRHEGFDELSGFPSVGECKNDLDEDKEIDNYIKNNEKPAETASTDEAFMRGSFTHIKINGKPLKVKEFPSLKESFSYKISNNAEEQADVDSKLNFHISLWSPDAGKVDLKPEDLSNKVHHFVFNQTAPNVTDFVKYLNENVNRGYVEDEKNQKILGKLISTTNCGRQTEHLNITTVQSNGTSTTERYILDCKNSGRRNKALSLRKI